MTFDAGNIIAALVFSAIGFIYLSYGRKQANFRLVLFGFALMVYSYATPTLAWNIGVGIVLTVLPLVWRG